jgi:HK97 family phage portal protein
MALLELLQRARTPTVRKTALRSGNDLAPLAIWQGWPGYENAYWPFVTEDQALGLPVVGGFLNQTTSLLLQMPLHGYRQGQTLATDPAILVNPTPGPARTFADFISEYLRDMFLFGNYVAVLGPKNPAGWPDLFVPVPNGQWEIQVQDSGYQYLVNGSYYRPEDIFHVSMNALNGQLIGRGILSLYPGLIASCVAAERWAASYFEGGAVPPGALKHPNPELTQAQADALKAKMRAVATAREWAILPGGTELEVLASDAEKSQLNETRKLNSQQLAMAIGIPGALLGLDSPSLTYRNITDVFQQFITTTVMSYVIPLEQQLTLQCLPRGTNARFLPGAVLRPDLPTRIELAIQSVQGGLYTTDQALSFFDLAPVDYTTEISSGGIHQ